MDPIKQDDHRGQQWTLWACLAASHRLRDHKDLDHLGYAAVGEGLFWACAADEGYMDLLGDTYKQARTLDDGGQLLAGIRWARNRMAHQRAITFGTHRGTELGSWILGEGTLGTVDHLKWASSTTIPSNGRDGGREVYDSCLAGRPVVATIEAAQRWLFGAALNEVAARAGFATSDMPGLDPR